MRRGERIAGTKGERKEENGREKTGAKGREERRWKE